MKIPAHYSLKQDHKDHYELHDKRDGKSFIIAKKPLEDSQHKQISKLPHYDIGTPDGAVGSPQDQNAPVIAGNYATNPMLERQVASNAGDTFSDVASNYQNQLRAERGLPAISQESTPIQAAPPAPEIPEPTKELPKEEVKTPDLALPPAAPTASNQPDILKQFAENQKTTESGLQNLGSAKSIQSQEEAKTLENQNYQMNKVFNDSQDKLMDINSENERLANAVATAKIDPQQYVHNMGTGNKILAAIGLALGGAGSGITGQPNLAYDVLQKAISEDIDAQKADLGKKQSLLSMNLQKYGSMERATQATMMQLNSITQGQIAQIAAKNGSAVNNANTQYILGNLKNQNLMAGQQLANGLATQQIARQAISGDGIPVQAMSLLPEKERANMVQLPSGSWASAGSPENAKAVNEASAPYKPLMQDLKSLKELNTMTTPFSAAQRNRATALQLHIVTELNDMAKAHRISEADIGFQEGQLSKPSSIMNKLSGDWNASTDVLMKSLSNKMDNVYKTYVPSYKGTQFTPKAK